MKRRLPIVLSMTALVVAVAGITPLGEAASDAIPRFARNADRVDGFHASRSPKAGRLLALNASRKFPASVFTSTGLSGLETVTAVTATDSSSPKVVVGKLSGRQEGRRRRSASHRNRREQRRRAGDGVLPEHREPVDRSRVGAGQCRRELELTAQAFCAAGHVAVRRPSRTSFGA